MRIALVIALAGTAALGCSGSIDGANDADPAEAGTGSVSSGGSSNSGGKGSTPSGGANSSAGTSGNGTSGSGSNQAGSAGSGTPVDCGSATDTGPSVLRRLSNLEYARTLQALFQLAEPPSLDGIPDDSVKDHFELAETQSVSALHLRAYLDKATELASDLLGDATRRAALIGCDVTAATCLDSFVQSFGKLAYRRPLEAAEVKAITDGAAEHATDAEDGFRYALQVLLTSPSFLFRVEVGDSPEGLSTLSASEVASRLSFALTGRGPSAELLEQAESDALLADMQGETDGLLDEFAWSNQNFLQVLTTSTTHLTPALATYYDLPAPDANGLLTIPADHVRAGTGIFTHASLLSAKRDGDLIAIRGNWLRTSFLCEQVEPIDLAAATEDLVGLTRVEIVQVRNMRPDCNGCHGLLDPIGVGFAGFDATGRYDDSIDTSVYGIETLVPDLEDGAFASIAELAQKLALEPAVSSCLAKRAFLFINGRAPADADSCTLAQATSGFTSANANFQSLLASLVTSPAFRVRRAPAAP